MWRHCFRHGGQKLSTWAQAENQKHSCGRSQAFNSLQAVKDIRVVPNIKPDRLVCVVAGRPGRR